MGRELRRVPLDFQWPHNKVWHGFVNPHYSHRRECAACGGWGASPYAQRLKAQWYGRYPFRPEERGSVPYLPDNEVIQRLARRDVTRWPSDDGSGEEAVANRAVQLCSYFNRRWSHHLNQDDVRALLAADRLLEFTHTFIPGQGWQPKEPAVEPTAAEVNLWSLQSLSHDSINCWAVVEAQCKRDGEPSLCAVCEGSGELWDSEEAKAACEAWTPEAPPEGAGYQVWETVSEGSPISPVFEEPEALAHWMAENPHGGDTGTTFEQWLAFIKGPGWAPTLVGTSKGLVSGVQAG